MLLYLRNHRLRTDQCTWTEKIEWCSFLKNAWYILFRFYQPNEVNWIVFRLLLVKVLVLRIKYLNAHLELRILVRNNPDTILQTRIYETSIYLSFVEDK